MRTWYKETSVREKCVILGVSLNPPNQLVNLRSEITPLVKGCLSGDCQGLCQVMLFLRISYSSTAAQSVVGWPAAERRQQRTTNSLRSCIVMYYTACILYYIGDVGLLTTRFDVALLTVEETIPNPDICACAGVSQKPFTYATLGNIWGIKMLKAQTLLTYN